MEDGYEVILLDESFFPVAPYITEGWFKIGSRPVMQYEHNRRDKHCVLGGLSQGQFVSMFAESIDSLVFECFVRQLIEKFGKVLLVMDHAPYHASWSMFGFYHANNEKIKIIFFPSYSPELDPTEQVWKETKKWLGTKCWQGKLGLKKELVSAFKEDFARVNFYDYLLP